MTEPFSPLGGEPLWKARLLDTVQRLAHEHQQLHQQYQPDPDTSSGRDPARHHRLEELRIACAEAETHARVAGLGGQRIAEARWRGLRGTGTQDKLVRMMLAPNTTRELLIGWLVDDLWTMQRMAALETVRLPAPGRALFEPEPALVGQFHHRGAQRWTRAAAISARIALSAHEQRGMWANTVTGWQRIVIGAMHTHDAATLESRWREYARPPESAMNIDYAHQVIIEHGGQHAVAIPRWDTMLAQARDTLAGQGSTADHRIRQTPEHTIGAAIHAAMPDDTAQDWSPPADPHNDQNPPGAEQLSTPDP